MSLTNAFLLKSFGKSDSKDTTEAIENAKLTVLP